MRGSPLGFRSRPAQAAGGVAERDRTLLELAYHRVSPDSLVPDGTGRSSNLQGSSDPYPRPR